MIYKKGEPIILLAGNYLVASIIALILLIFSEARLFSFQTLIFGAGLGLLFVLSFFAYATAISYAGTGLATTSSRLSVIIPILLSILIFNELPNKLHLVGFVFTLITFILFYFSVRGNRKDGEGVLKYLFLIAVFAGIGINDFAIKVFKSWRPEQEEPYFIFFIFSSAFVYSSIYITSKKVKISKNTVLLGLILGIPNVFRYILSTWCTGITASYYSLPVDECGNNSSYYGSGFSNLERKTKPLGRFSSRQRSVGDFIFESWWIMSF